MSLDVVGSYWAGVLERLQSEVNIMNELILHSGTKGAENEASLSRLVKALIPSQYGVGSGLVFDVHGNYSKQMDIVIFDNHNLPSLLAQSTQVLYPVESVLLCVEVKTTVDGREIKDALEKKKSLLALDSEREKPGLALFGFRASQQARTLANHLLDASEGFLLDFACVAGLGLVANPSPDNDGQLEAGVSPLSVGQGFEMANGEDIGIAAIRGNRSYPIVQLPDADYIVDASRALLLFCEQLMRSIGSDGASLLSRYITDEMRALVMLRDE